MWQKKLMESFPVPTPKTIPSGTQQQRVKDQEGVQSQIEQFLHQTVNLQRSKSQTLQIVLSGQRANLICTVKGAFILRQTNEHQESLTHKPSWRELPRAT